jgi:squalene cyclase
MIAKLKQMETEFTSRDDLDGLGGVQHARASDPSRQARVERRAMDWLIGMQSANGGWAAFDVDNDWQLLNKVPFADHNAMLDSTCPDITGRVMEALCHSRSHHQDAVFPLVERVHYHEESF